MKILSVLWFILASFSALAWMESWAPNVKFEQAETRKLPPKSIRYFVSSVMPDEGEFRWEYSKGGAIDLNEDGIEDFIFIVPWMGCGLNASGYTAYFVVSSKGGGRILTTIDGYGAELTDVVKKEGKLYYRQSNIHGHLENSLHNHWVYQLYSFGVDGKVSCANADFGQAFPAVTIFYTNPKFKQIELTEADRKQIREKACITSRSYTE